MHVLTYADVCRRMQARERVEAAWKRESRAAHTLTYADVC
jgi:hypothetical protein